MNVESGRGVLLYGRHSSELQNPRSTSDQLAFLRSAAHARDWVVRGEFADEAVSGAHLHRPGLRALLALAERGCGERVFAEALDRISRDQEGVAHVFKRLSFAGVVLETLSEGVITELHVGLTGTMNQLFLKELANKTRRGLVGRVQAGFSGGGRCYGYDLVDTGAQGERGVLRVNEAEARVVRRIFRDFVGGDSPRTIARTLNAEGTPGPRGGAWSASSVRGDRRAQDGVLNQELYVGVRLFNRRRFRRHPETGRRSSVLNPADTWVRAPVPELRLMTDLLWRAAQDRLNALSRLPASHGARPRRLLSQLMTCGLCGSSMVLSGRAYVCRRAREERTCANHRTIVAGRVEARLLEHLPPALLSPLARRLAAEAIRHDRLHKPSAGRSRGGLDRDLLDLDLRLSRLRTLFVAGHIEMDELRQRQTALQAARDRVAARRRERERSTALEDRAWEQAYEALAGNLPHVVEDADAGEVRTELRKLFGQAVFTPLPARGAFQLHCVGSDRWPEPSAGASCHAPEQLRRPGSRRT